MRYIMAVNTYAINNKTRYSEWLNLNKSYRTMLKENKRTSLAPNKIPKYSNFGFKFRYLRREILKNRLIRARHVYGYDMRGASMDKCGRTIVSYRLKPSQKILVTVHILDYASIYDEEIIHSQR